MIAKRVTRSRTRDTFKRLGLYILSGKEKAVAAQTTGSEARRWQRTAAYVLDLAGAGGRLGAVRITNCAAAEPADAIAEIQATQAMNIRAKGDKTYHLVVSFPPGEQPTEEQIRDIENELCAAIGLADHQRLSAVHTDTDHLHIHIAINQVHPATRRCVEPYYDKRKLMAACDRLEIKHGLEQTNHAAREGETMRGRDTDMEAFSGQEALTSWIRANALDEIHRCLRDGQGWQNLHDALAAYDLAIRPRGAGLVIATADGKLMVRASRFSRALSFQSLVKRWGTYTPASGDRPPATMRYEREPKRKKPSSARLWAEYQDARKTAMATRAVAMADLHYHPALGAPVVGKFYAPWTWLTWQVRYKQNAPAVFAAINAAGGAIGAIAALGQLAALGAQGRTAQRHEGVHGTAHWAARDEIEATGLLPRRGQRGAGVYVGGWRDDRDRLHYLRHNGPEHVAAIAPTRSGKGVGLVVPTLLSWPHSLVVNDQKAELWHLSAGWRASEAGNVVLRFDPGAASGSIGFNPLDEIRLGTLHEVGDVQNLVTILVDPEGKGLVDHWAKTSHAFLTGAILHVLYRAKATGGVGALPQVALALSDPARPVAELYREMLDNTWAGGTGVGGQTHPTIAAAARDMTNRPDEERGSVLSTAMSFLSLYRDPLIAKNVSRSDFRIMDLMNHGQPVSLYLVVRVEDKDRMKPLMRLIINQLVRVLLRPEIAYARGRPAPPHKHRMLLMLDEFPSYGKLEVFQEALAYIAGHGIKAYLIMQDIAQLWGAYGRDESIISNCHVRAAYAPNKIETADWLSKMTGTATIVKEDITTSGGRFSAVLSNVSRTFHQISRPLATPDEIMRLKSPAKNESDVITEPGDMLVFVAGHAPILGTQSLYFRDPVFNARATIPPPAGDQAIPAPAPRRPFRA